LTRFLCTLKKTYVYTFFLFYSFFNEISYTGYLSFCVDNCL